MNKSIFLPALTAALLTSSLAMAGDKAATKPGQAPQQVVQYGDLDLDTESGRTSLQRRVRQAAESVCPDTRGRVGRAREVGRQCVKQAITQAWAKIEDQQRVAQTGAPAGNRG